MTPEEAIKVVARYAAAQMMAEVAENWDGYPDIGEFDWERVVHAADELADELEPDMGEYNAAYELLAGRAEA